MTRPLTICGALAAATAALLLLTAGAEAIVGGSADQGAHPYVGAAEFTDASGFTLCSGSLLSATVLVTAAHCFPDGARVTLTFDEDARSSAHPTTFTGTAHDDPSFCLACGRGVPGFDTSDLAVVVLDGAGAPRSRYAVLPAVGAADTVGTVDVVGYGVQSFDGKAPSAVGTRRVATTRRVGGGAIGDEFLKLLADPGICLGDSGGPNLVHGTDVVVGVTSFSPKNPHCNGVSYSERLDTPQALAFVGGFLSG